MKYPKEKLKEIAEAILCIMAGTISGIAVYAFCIIIHLAIFGWNLGLVIAPLVAGYVETQIAIKYIGETTGAISAYILFFITVIYGFILTNPTLGLNGITIGSFFIIMQAAFPTLVNYFGIVVLIGTLSYFTGIFKKITDKLYYTFLKIRSHIRGEEYIPPERALEETDFDENQIININDLGVLFLSTTHPWGKSVKDYKGIYEGRIIIPNDAKIFELHDEELLENLKNAKDQAILNLASHVKKDGANGVLDLTIEYDAVGDIKGKSFQIIARGTGVILE